MTSATNTSLSAKYLTRCISDGVLPEWCGYRVGGRGFAQDPHDSRKSFRNAAIRTSLYAAWWVELPMAGRSFTYGVRSPGYICVCTVPRNQLCVSGQECRGLPGRYSVRLQVSRDVGLVGGHGW